MLKRGEKGANERSSFTASSTKGQKYQRMFDDGVPDRKEEQEEEEKEEEDSSERSSERDRVSALKNRRSWSGSLPSAFTFAPYQSF